MPLKILLVDDHIAITDSYKYILTEHFNNEADITTANTLQFAYETSCLENNKSPFDVAILDLSMPPYLEKNINSGEDLALQLRLKSTKTKIIIHTGLSQKAQLIRIINTINPEGIFEKCDVGHKELIAIIDLILNRQTFKSKTIIKTIGENNTTTPFLDKIDIKIIQLIAQGIKTKNLHLYIPITTSAIDKRKAKIKQLLGIESGNDEDIIREARKLGLIN
jgi:DNA-binding NarL/FixJ family response regulator